MMREDGLTVVELIVVISIIGILVVAFSSQFAGWRSGYTIESQIKQMRSDLINARARAMQRARIHFVTLAATQYSLYEDTNPTPDGNGTLEVALDTRVLQTSLRAVYPITWSDLATTTLAFAQTGLPNVDMTICDNHSSPSLLQPDSTPDYDCIIIQATRLSLGKLTTHLHAGGTCDTGNCVAK
jgi:prepilin-type N-terminal cleavage/methylation domain-containing protein